MTSSRTLHHRRAGFTLVELLTVVSIIALLISILLPSLANARRQARNVTISKMFNSIETGMEQFHLDFNEYPDSTRREDPIDYNLAVGNGGLGLPNGDVLSGAHWLARAMRGYDTQGMDAGGASLRGAPASVSETALRPTERKTPYMEGNIYASDADANVFRAGGSFAITERAVVKDIFGGPILYYRANPRAQLPMSNSVSGGGIYNFVDNVDITGSLGASLQGWMFKEPSTMTPAHTLGVFGSILPGSVNDPPSAFGHPGKGKTFTAFLHDHAKLTLGNVVKPVLADKFVLISSGEDGTFGTDDDIANYEPSKD